MSFSPEERGFPAPWNRPTEKLLIPCSHREVLFEPVRIHSDINGLALLIYFPVLLYLSLLTQGVLVLDSVLPVSPVRLKSISGLLVLVTIEAPGFKI